MYFGIIPTGSANGLATDLNIPKKLEESCQLLSECFCRNGYDVINGRTSLHLSDLGLNAGL
jgi:diacylglycerol kinase family enzyme